MVHQTDGRKVIVVGGGRVGRRTAAQLAESGYMVTLIERDEAKAERIPAHLVSRVVVGDGADVDVFQDPAMAGVVAGLTNDTETNLAVCELAREMVAEIRTLVRIGADGERAYAHLEYVDNVMYPAAAGASVASTRITMDESVNLTPSQLS